MKSLWRYLKKYRKECVLAPLFKMLEASFELMVPLVMARGSNIPLDVTLYEMARMTVAAREKAAIPFTIFAMSAS